MANNNRRADAARQNGARSNGPKSQEGRVASARNSLKHGLTSNKLYVLDNENPEEYQAVLGACIQAFCPKTDLEMELVEEMAGARWRLRRVRSIETEIFNTKMHDQIEFFAGKDLKPTAAQRRAHAFSTLGNHTMSLAQLARYESRLQRTYERAVDNLKKLRALSEAEENTRQEQQLAEVPNEPGAPPVHRPATPCIIEIKPRIQPSEQVPDSPHALTPELREQEQRLRDEIA